MHKSALNVQFLLHSAPLFLEIFFILNDGTDGLTIGEHVKRFYVTDELGRLTCLPLGLVDALDQIKSHMFQLPLCPGYHSEKKEREKQKEDVGQDR